MMEKKSKFSILDTFKYAGATIALLIGSGFATGQEIIQYFVAHGHKGIYVAIILFILLSFVVYELTTAGFRNRFDEGNDIFYYYGGKYLGAFYDYFATFVLFLSFIVLVAGAGATGNQHLNLPVWVGSVSLGVVAVLAGLLGIKKIIDIIGKIGPLVVVIVIALGLTSIIKNYGELSHITENLHKYQLLKASDNWFLGALSYVGFNMIWLMAFVSQMGKEAKSVKELKYSSVLGAFLFSLGIVILYLGLLSVLPKIQGSQIPNLAMATLVSPVFATVFSVLIFIEIFNTSVPLLWSVVTRFSDEGEKKYYIWMVVLGIAGTILGMMVRFDKLVNIVYSINGYVGFTLLLVMIYKFIKVRVTHSIDKEAKEIPSEITINRVKDKEE